MELGCSLQKQTRMREVVCVQIGKYGTTVGDLYWEKIGAEHGFDNEGKCSKEVRGTSNVYFNEGSDGKYIPRSVFVDSEPGTIDAIKSGKRGRLYRPENFIAGKLGTGNNFAVGYYEIGPELRERLMDSIRKEAEACESLSGFQICHAVGGGTGSGLNSLLLAWLAEDYINKIVANYTLLPSDDYVSNVLEIYNATLSFNHLIEYSNFTMLYDNHALHRICSEEKNYESPSFQNMNDLAATGMSEVTSSYRFPGLKNNDMRKHCTNIILFPRIHFLYSALTPYAPHQLHLNEKETIEHLFNPTSAMCTMNHYSRHYTYSTCFRGNWSTGEVEKELFCYKYCKNSYYFTEWIPDSQISFCSTPPITSDRSAYLVTNSAAMDSVIGSLAERSKELLDKKAFLHMYASRGMSSDDMMEYTQNAADVASEYRPYVPCYEDYDCYNEAGEQEEE